MPVHQDLRDPEWVAQARSSDPTRPVLHAIHVDHAGRRLVATDGVRMHLIESPDPVVATEQDGLYPWTRVRQGWPDRPPDAEARYVDFERVLGSLKGRWRHLPADISAAIAFAAQQANLELERWERRDEFLVVVDTDQKGKPAFLKADLLYQALRGAFRRGIEPWPIYYRITTPTTAMEVMLLGSGRRAVVMPMQTPEKADLPLTRVAFDLRPYVDDVSRNLPEYDNGQPEPHHAPRTAAEPEPTPDEAADDPTEPQPVVTGDPERAREIAREIQEQAEAAEPEGR